MTAAGGEAPASIATGASAQARCNLALAPRPLAVLLAHAPGWGDGLRGAWSWQSAGGGPDGLTGDGAWVEIRRGGEHLVEGRPVRASILFGSALLCLTGCYSGTGSYARDPLVSQTSTGVRHR